MMDGHWIQVRFTDLFCFCQGLFHIICTVSERLSKRGLPFVGLQVLVPSSQSMKRQSCLINFLDAKLCEGKLLAANSQLGSSSIPLLSDYNNANN